MVNKILESIKNVSMTKGRYLSDKTYKYDTVFFVSKYIYDLAGGLSSFEINNETMAGLVKRIANDFSLPEGSYDANRNYILETLSFLQYANVIEKCNQTSYKIINYDSLDFITVSIENAYIFQYLVAYQTFVNDGLWDLYLDYIKPDDKEIRKAKLMKIKDIMCSKSASIGDPDSVWALNVVKFSIMVLGLANDDNKVTRGLDIKDERITPKDLSANVEGTRTRATSEKHNFYIHDFRINYVKRILSQLSCGKGIIDKFSPEWFNARAKEFIAEDVEATAIYADFKAKYGIAALQALSGEDLLKAMFLGGSTDNLCHELEYVKRVNDLFGSCKGGTVYKYPLFFDKETSTWMTGTRFNPVALSLNEAIIKGTAIRDSLAQAVAIIEATTLGSVEDYLALYTKLYSVIPDIVDGLWVSKYFHMLFPQVLPVFYNKEWQVKVLTVLNLVPSDAAYGRMGQINEFVKQCNISNVVFAQIFYKYCRFIDVEPEEETSEDAISVTRIKGGENIILYGVPGAGKSWTIKNEYCNDESCMERLVFHPDYTYSDFVGQIMPKVTSEGTVSYEFSPGPFAKLVKKAYANPDKMFYLIIEEVNRGNAPAIFGDVFQLLDRQSRLILDKSTGQLVENESYGASEYEITNADVARVVYGNENHKVSIPSNMSILCTMNTSDQNVFTLDTAFQRRWSMRLIQNQFPEDGSENAFANTHILDTTVTWERFFTVINDLILGKNIRMTSAEDKRLGTHFVSQEDLILDDYSGDDKDLIKQASRQNRRFAEKVLKYLWDDAFKFNKDEIFDISKVNSLEKVISVFVTATGNARFEGIFKPNIYDALVPKQ